jgi:hypothetical protein
VAQKRAQKGRKRIRRQRRPPWAKLTDEQLLELRFCDLGLTIRGSFLESRVKQVLDELRNNNLRFRSHFWLSNDWYTPDGVPGVALPFYLAHPRLMRLEERQMLEVEGGTHGWCMRLMRHEVGHAICNAYRLHRKRAWQSVFGKASIPYPDYYRPRPYSKRFVLHLDYWYAQSHPTEDFAETFAVWLTPNIPWRKRYAGWPALKKLEFVDSLMTDIADTEPPVTTRTRTEPLPTLRATLRSYYEEKRARYGVLYPDFYDRDLMRLFEPDDGDGVRGMPAGKFLRRNGPRLRRLVAAWTGEYQYTINEVLKEMARRCDELRLRVTRTEDDAMTHALIMLTVQTMNHLHSGHHRLAI